MCEIIIALFSRRDEKKNKFLANQMLFLTFVIFELEKCANLLWIQFVDEQI